MRIVEMMIERGGDLLMKNVDVLKNKIDKY
jgi:hypothetical protein